MEKDSTAQLQLEFRLLGRFVVVRDGHEVPVSEFGGRKVRSLLRMLAARRGQFVPNDVLAEQLWPEHPPADPAANLHVLVNRARRALRADVVLTGPGGYALTDAAWCVLDTDVLLGALRRCAGLDGPLALQAYAVALAGGAAEPLAEDRYADWAAPLRDEIARTRQEAWERAAQLALVLGESTTAVEYATAAHRADPLRETAALLLVSALAAAGDNAGALSRYDRYRAQLSDELGVDPSPAATDLHARLLRSRVPPVRPPPTPSRPTFEHLRFVGREGALAAMARSLDDSEGRSSRVVRVTGPSGSGKSRLLAEFAKGRPAARARAYWPDRDEPWALARSILRELAAAAVEMVEALPDQLRSALAPLVPDLEPTRPMLDAQSRRALVIEAAVRLASSHPDLVLIVDDFQWADPISVRLLAAIVARREAGVVLAYRPESVEAGSEGAVLLQQLASTPLIELGPLDQSAIHELIGEPGLADALIAATDLTALALTEVLRRLEQDQLAVRNSSGTWIAASDAAAARAAEIGALGQQQAIARRVSDLSAPALLVVQVLALLARSTGARTLGNATGMSETEVLRHLAALAATDLVRLREQGWQVAHEMVGEVVAAGLDEPSRLSREVALARVLDDENADPAERSLHWAAAGDPVRAARAYALAANRALQTWADDEAERLADAGLACMAASAVDPLERASLYEVRAQAHRRRGRLPAARADLRAALHAYPPGPHRSRTLTQLATVASGADDLLRASELAELAVIEAGTDEAARAQALEVASVIDMNVAQAERADTRAAEALQIYTRLGDSRGAARILDARAMATFLERSVTMGTELLDRAAHLFEDSGDLMRMVTPRSTCGHGRVLSDKPELGILDAEQALYVARILGHPESQAYSLWHCAEASAALDRAGEAVAYGEEALAIATQIQHRGWTATAWRAIGLGRESRGDVEEAREAYLNSLAHSTNLGLFGCWAAARAALSCVALGQLPRATELVAQTNTGPALGQHEARWARAALAVARGDDGAMVLVTEAAAAARQAGARLYLRPLEALATA